MAHERLSRRWVNPSLVSGLPPILGRLEATAEPSTRSAGLALAEGANILGTPLRAGSRPILVANGSRVSRQ